MTQEMQDFLSKSLLDVISIIIAIIAIAVSIITSKKQEKNESPYCRIKAASRRLNMEIRVENVGTGIMKVQNVYYANREVKEKIKLFLKHLTKLLKKPTSFF